MNVAPVLRISGTVHQASARRVAAVSAAPAERDPETGRIVKDAVEARDAYDVLDVTVHTNDGGYALVVVRGDVVEDKFLGAVPNKGDNVDWPVRTYISWAGRAGRRFPTVGFAVAGEHLEAVKAGRRADLSVSA